MADTLDEDAIRSYNHARAQNLAGNMLAEIAKQQIMIDSHANKIAQWETVKSKPFKIKEIGESEEAYQTRKASQEKLYNDLVNDIQNIIQEKSDAENLQVQDQHKANAFHANQDASEKSAFDHLDQASHPKDAASAWMKDLGFPK